MVVGTQEGRGMIAVVMRMFHYYEFLDSLSLRSGVVEFNA